jgi:hypothetical protein
MVLHLLQSNRLASILFSTILFGCQVGEASRSEGFEVRSRVIPKAIDPIRIIPLAGPLVSCIGLDCNQDGLSDLLIAERSTGLDGTAISCILSSNNQVFDERIRLIDVLGDASILSCAATEGITTILLHEVCGDDDGDDDSGTLNLFQLLPSSTEAPTNSSPWVLAEWRSSIDLPPGERIVCVPRLPTKSCHLLFSFGQSTGVLSLYSVSGVGLFNRIAIALPETWISQLSQGASIALDPASGEISLISDDISRMEQLKITEPLSRTGVVPSQENVCARVPDQISNEAQLIRLLAHLTRVGNSDRGLRRFLASRGSIPSHCVDAVAARLSKYPDITLLFSLALPGFLRLDATPASLTCRGSTVARGLSECDGTRSWSLDSSARRLFIEKITQNDRVILIVYFIPGARSGHFRLIVYDFCHRPGY